MSAAGPGPRPPSDRGQGRKRFTPTEQQKRLVVLLRAAGAPPATIAREIGISNSKLHLHFADELQNGKATVVNRITGKLIQRALRGHFQSQDFYLSSFGGSEWRQTSRHELTGLDGVPLKPPDLIVNFVDPIGVDGPGQPELPALVLHPGGRADA